MIKKQKRYNLIIIISLLALYIPALITIVFFLPPHERKVKIYQYYYIPLQSTIAQIKDPQQYNTPGYWRVVATGIAGNFLLFVPFGFISQLIFPNKKKIILFFYAVSASALIELTQLVFHSGVSDIDDVILNSLGAISGIWLLKLFNTIFKIH